ncbi:MAG: hypothetical protein GWN32_02220 [Gemmatimonadetes bacterium]|nr:hypothetical protein [Gemmatimonadota bacterium]
MPVVGAQYWNCRTSGLERADEIMRDVILPVIKVHVDAGHLTGANWLGHQIGGGWDRALATFAPSMDALLDMRAAILSELNSEHAEAVEEFNNICGNHADYLWQNQVSSGSLGVTNDVQASAGVTQYYECDQRREGWTDIIVGQTMASVMNTFVESGQLASWGWSSHLVGGNTRRILTMRGADAKSVMNAWGAMTAALNEQRPMAMGELLDICPRHTDYLWSILETI